MLVEKNIALSKDEDLRKKFLHVRIWKSHFTFYTVLLVFYSTFLLILLG